MILRSFLACVVECGGAPPLSDAEKKLRTLRGLDPRSQTLVFAVWIGFKAPPQKRQDTAALQNLAVILRSFLACVVECGGAPPLSDAAYARPK